MDEGITPACAGKSLSAEIQGLEAEDHPRVCGEKSPFPACLALPPGSPPRVRGKVLDYRVGADSGGITPACAGKSQQRNIRLHLQKDHPRVCGEKPIPLIFSTKASGSPPRVRGKAVLFKEALP